MTLVGRITAGGSVLAEQAVENVFPLPRQLVGDGALFLLQVIGDEMIDAICDGDWVVVRQQPVAETVTSSRDGRRRGHRADLPARDGHLWLMPHNAAYEPIPGDDATVLGRVTAALPHM